MLAVLHLIAHQISRVGLILLPLHINLLVPTTLINLYRFVQRLLYRQQMGIKGTLTYHLML
jgi:hypothetical protein